LIIHSSRILIQHTFRPGQIHLQGPLIGDITFDPKEVWSSKEGFWDLGDRPVTPAWINPHTHIAMGFFRHFSPPKGTLSNMIRELFFTLESSLTSDDVRAFARIGAMENILQGVGLVWDHYYFGKALAQACRDTGLSAVIAPTLQDLSGPGKDSWEEALLTTHELTSPAWTRDGIYSALGPHATDTVSGRLMGEILGIAQKDNLPIHMHLAQTKEEVAYHDPTAWLESLGFWEMDQPSLLVHGIYLKSFSRKLWRDPKKVLCFCPFSQMIFERKLAPVKRWEKARIPWCVGTDSVASNDSMNVQKELRFVGGIFPEEAKDPGFLLDRVWGIPGGIHPGFRAGVIEKGALGNLLIWDPDHPSLWPGEVLRSWAMTDSAEAIWGMVLRGQVLGVGPGWKENYMEKVGYREMVKEAKGRLKGLVAVDSSITRDCKYA
jgi:5-methylthioadenosine/S-adenosylhomocysteine deaminase